MNQTAGRRQIELMALLHTASAMEAGVEAKLEGIGLSMPKLMALHMLSEAGESLPLSQLAERLSCVKSNITQLVDRLEADGFVARKPDPNDRRSRLAVMTPAGRKASKAGMRLYRDAERELQGQLTADEAHQLATLLEKVGKRSA